MTRAAGLLLHPTSLPGRFGIGDLGPEAERFLDWARDGGQSWWQVLPLGPPEAHHSPYNCLSAFAGNPLLISPELLRREGLLTAGDLAGVPGAAPGRVDFDRVAPWKEGLLRRSWELFERRGSAELRDELRSFVEDPAQGSWLDDWTLFQAIRARRGGSGWWDWEPALARREAATLAAARRSEAAEIGFHRYLQFQFMRQWRRLRREARRRGVRILGDLPIYVAANSAEVWAHRELFDLDSEGRPRAVAGVPPDAFSSTGQLWGNPLYRWDRIAAAGFGWWIERLAHNLRLVDRVRIDHFRGFAAYWRIPAAAPTAEGGKWVEGPGLALFEALRRALPAAEPGGELPLVAEDLGVITPDVVALRRAAGLPGMKVLQFAFDDPASDHLPHRFERAMVVYTGTHDNDTTAGWLRRLGDDARGRVRSYAGDDVPWALIRLAYTSVADTAVVPLQDVLALGSEARMNTPAVAAGNWAWRLAGGELDAELAGRLRRLAEVSGRLPPAARGG